VTAPADAKGWLLRTFSEIVGEHERDHGKLLFSGMATTAGGFSVLTATFSDRSKMRIEFVPNETLLTGEAYDVHSDERTA
jgi:hypothetical protein